MTKIVWELPLKTISEANSTEHWHKKAKRHSQQKMFIRSLFRLEPKVILPPCIVKMTRMAPRKLDADDNLRMAFKWIKDEISECLFPEKQRVYLAKNGKIRTICGRNDDNPLVKWEYDQEKSPIVGVRIEIESLAHNRPVDTRDA